MYKQVAWLFCIRGDDLTDFRETYDTLNIRGRNIVSLKYTSPTENDFRSSIFHLWGCMLLITRYMYRWKMQFLCHLSSTFIFHLPPSIWQVRFMVCVWYVDRCICYPISLYHLKQFVFLSTFSENGWVLISSPVRRLVGPGMRAHRPRYAGPWARIPGLR